MNEKMQELLSNEAFVKKAINLSPEDAQKLFVENGCDISVEEIKKIGEEINNIVIQMNNGELDEEALENVAGGGNHLGMFIAGVVIGAAIAISW